MNIPPVNILISHKAIYLVFRVFFPVFLFCGRLPAQQFSIQVSANERVPVYKGAFGYGSNMGYFPPYDDKKLADIAAGNASLGIGGVGVTSLRPALFEYFLEYWGYNIRVDQFRYYQQLGMKDNVCFIGYPSVAHRDNTVYCGKDSSTLFKNMYLPIWKPGKEGVEVNDSNYYARYVYQMVKTYKGQVRFWEIWNEPDYAYSYNTTLPAGQKGSWWSENPSPCDYSLHAPIQHYIRLLRISYEVIKSLDPEGFVTLGGIGFPSFLDCILRQTDNPDEGKVTTNYPLKGGAYFDVVSYHAYPHTDNSLREWSNDINGFVYHQHSDRAANGVFSKQDAFNEVLNNYGYDGKKYPFKKYIITESNVPGKTFGDYYGSYEYQRNFALKALVKCQEHEVLQYHLYSLGQLKNVEAAKSEFEVMGLYYQLEGQTPYLTSPTQAGVAYKTISGILGGYQYDSIATRSLNLPSNVDGAAFSDASNHKEYVLWAKTMVDRSEKASAYYSFPASFGVDNFQQRNWDYSTTGERQVVSSRLIQLSGAPAFFRATTLPNSSFLKPETMYLYPNPTTGDLYINYQLVKDGKVSLRIYDMVGREQVLVFEDQLLSSGLHEWRLDTGGLVEGVYLASLVIEGQGYAKKFVVGR